MIATPSSGMDVLAQAIVDASTHDTSRGIYFIGVFSGRINFFSQQLRALNLVWALLRTGSLKSTSRVAIIGGGLAGATAAVAVLNKNLQVDLFEQYAELFHLQRNNVTRQVHPTVNFWPAVGLTPSTNFPFLNWYEASPSQIIAWVEAEMEHFFSDIVVHYSTPIQTIKTHNAVHYLETGDSRRFGPFDAVIVACGFGLERRFPGMPVGVAHSYWANEDLLPLGPPSGKQTLFVSGSGDGALIEIIRGSLKKFQNGREITELAKLLDRSPAKAAIRSLLDAELSAPPDYWDTNIAARYLELPVPQSFISRIKANLTGGSEVILNARNKGLFGSNSAFIHRLIVAHLIALGRVECVVGELITVDGTSTPFNVVVSTGGGAGTADPVVEWKRQVSRILIRHGASRSLDWVLTPAQQTALASRQKQIFANSLQGNWTDGYFSDAERFPPFGTGDYLRHYLPRVREYFANVGDASGVGIGRLAREYAYVVQCDTERAKAALPDRFFGVPVIGRLSPSDVRAYSASDGVHEDARGRSRIHPGIPVSVGQGGPLVSLSCFVSTMETPFAAMVPLHMDGFEENGELKLASGELIGRLIRTAPMTGNPKSDDFRSARKAQGSVGLFELSHSLPIDPTPPGHVKWKRVASRGEILSYVGSKVFKAAAKSGLTRGTLNAVEVDIRISSAIDREAETYAGLFDVTGAKGGRFSRPGDSGSLVFTPDGLILGMIVAGSESGKHTFCAVLADIFESLSCQIVLDSTVGSHLRVRTRRNAAKAEVRDHIFISYSREDQAWAKQIESLLQPLTRANQLTVSDASALSAGTNWREQIEKQISEAKVIVLLLSPHYLRSQFSAEFELPVILNRARQANARVIAIPVSPLELPDTLYGVPIIKLLSRPLSSMSAGEREIMLARVVTEIASAASEPGEIRS